MAARQNEINYSKEELKAEFLNLLKSNFGEINIESKVLLADDYNYITEKDDFGEYVTTKFEKENIFGADFKDPYKLFPCLFKIDNYNGFYKSVEHLHSMDNSDRKGCLAIKYENDNWYFLMKPELLFELLISEPIEWARKILTTDL